MELDMIGADALRVSEDMDGREIGNVQDNVVVDIVQEDEMFEGPIIRVKVINSSRIRYYQRRRGIIRTEDPSGDANPEREADETEEGRNEDII